jgi:hypothetical protein
MKKGTEGDEELTEEEEKKKENCLRKIKRTGRRTRR